jgi:transposase InsO family protein
MDRVKYKILDKLYLGKGSSVRFAGQQHLYRAAKQHKITLQNVRDYLAQQRVWTLHKPVRRAFPRLPTNCDTLDMLHESDLLDLQKHAKNNEGYRYILCVIDCLSRFAWVRPLRTKSSRDVMPALQDIYEKSKHRLPVYFLTDRGTEYFGSPMPEFFRSHGIIHYSTGSELGAAIAERWIRTFKTRLFKLMAKEKRYRWIGVLQELVDSYNSQIHRITGMAPRDVTLKNHTILYRQKLQNFTGLPKPAFAVGDRVRKAVKKDIFEKGYTPTYSAAIFTVAEVIFGPVVTFRLTGQKGKFYKQELVKAAEND